MRCSAALLLCVALGCRPEGPATPSDTAEVTPDTDRPCDEQDWYADGDADGYGDPAVVERACTAPLGTVGNAEDCDDTDPAVSPAGVELCNTTDDDCDGAVDEDAADAATWYADADGDGFGDAGATSLACEAPVGTLADAEDCDDTDPAVSPAGVEVCNTTDDDCDGAIDEDAADAATWYADADGDGFGDAGAPSFACEAPIGALADAADCDDTDPAVSPAGVELCNTTDDDCDGAVDEDAADAATWYADADGDGFGDASDPSFACEAPIGALADDDDCDDTDPAVSPTGVEVCNTMDDDCDGAIDEDAADAATWYADADGDGFGDAGATSLACEAPIGALADDDDCDDTDPAVSPAGVEVCNTTDDNCDGAVDEDAADAATWYADADGDGFGDAGATSLACEAPVGTRADAGDCDDTAASVHIGAAETCGDGVDQDCDGSDERCGLAVVAFGDADIRIDGGFGRGGSAWTNGQVGQALATGDTNGDGVADVLIGAPYPDGEARLAIGPVTSGNFSSATLLNRGSWYERVGAALATGDLDGDGMDESVVGAPGDYYYYPADAYVYSGGVTPSLEHSIAVAGESFATGDTNADGLDDLLLYNDKQWYLFQAPLPARATTSDAATHLADGEVTWGYGGRSGAMGDLDADGFDDLVMAVTGGAAVVFGPPPSGSLVVADADTFLSEDAAALAVGDGDGDGDDDLFLADGTSPSGRLAVYLFLDVGPGTLTRRDAAGALVGDTSAPAPSLATADFDQDGIDDILVGDYRSGWEPGSTRLWYGALSGTVGYTDAAFLFEGGSVGDYAGWAVAAGDVTGDGFPDAIVGAMGATVDGAALSGVVYGVSLQGR